MSSLKLPSTRGAFSSRMLSTRSTFCRCAYRASVQHRSRRVSVLVQPVLPICRPRITLDRRSSVLVASASAVLSPTSPHLQLGTAKLPKTVIVDGFTETLYQWAAGLTQSGSNLPFAAALQTDRFPGGFKIEFLGRMASGGFAPVAILVATVEEEAQGNVLFIRLYEGTAAWSTMNSDQVPAVGSPERLEKLLNGLPDVKMIMQTFPAAIRKAVKYAS